MTFLISPTRAARISTTSQAIFGHMTAANSQYGPGHYPALRSPRPLLMKKLKGRKLANWNYPFIRPQILSDRVFRQEEARQDKYEDAWEKKLTAAYDEIESKAGRLVKREVVPLRKGKKREGGGE